MNKETKQDKKRQRRFYWIIGGIVVVLAVIYLLNQYTENTSEIEVSPTGNDASIFIDRSQVGRLNPNTPSKFSVSDGRHQVLVASDGYWPWTEDITINDDESVKVTPFLIEQAGRRAVQIPTELTNALAQKQSKPTPTKDNPVLSPDENILVYVDGDTNIIAQWRASTSSAPDYFNCFEGTCGISVYNQNQIRDIEFYPKRNDVIFFSTDSGVYAIEIDPSPNTQNYQPVVDGILNPVFVFDENRIFVSSEGRVTVSEI